MTRRQFLVRVLAAALPALFVAACGKKEAPQHPQGSRYPRKYPRD